jgi:diphthamide biosynthesis methyltransferase
VPPSFTAALKLPGSHIAASAGNFNTLSSTEDLQHRARERNIPVKVIHNASVMNAVGACGLQLYRFGEAISVVFFTETWRPDSFYDKIAANRRLGLHTLCLLDIKVWICTAVSVAPQAVQVHYSAHMTSSSGDTAVPNA